MVTNKENLFKLGKKITDRIPYKLGLKKLDEECPEYWGFKDVLDDEMVEIALTMKKRTPYFLRELVQMTGKEEEHLYEKLEEMARIGLLEYHYGEKYDQDIPHTRENRQYYISMYVPGSAEMLNMHPTLPEEHPEVTRFFERMTFLPLEKVTAMVPPGGAGIGMHVIPVEKAIPAEAKSISIEHISHWLEKYDGHIGVGVCSCRRSETIQGRGSGDIKDDWCVGVGEFADYLVETGKGRRITKEEALAIFQRAEDLGYVHQITNIDGANKIFGMCNCAPGVCYALRTSQLFNTPNMSRSAYRAHVDKEKCVACGKCVEVCPAGAARLGQKLCAKTGPVTYPKHELPDAAKWGPEKWSPNYKELNRLNCYDSGTSPCKAACPAHIAVQGYLKMAAQGRYMDALRLIKQDNPFPAVCGAICNRRCEAACTRGTIDRPVAIDEIKKFVAGLELKEEHRYIPPVKNFKSDPNARYPEKIAIIGAGPAGLSCAFYLANMGYENVTVFDRNQKPGGMLTMGIPSFRLERDVIEAEIDVLRQMGVKFQMGVNVGKDVTIQQLREQGYKGFYIAIGAQKSAPIGIPGEELEGVFGGVGFLREVNSDKAPALGRKCAVIGGGNVAMDVCRTAIRLGAETTIVYRRSQAEMPADPEEVAEAMREGVQFRYLNAPVEILGQDGKVCGLKVEIMELGEPDEKGRRAPVGTGKFEIIEVDSVIGAIGQRIDWGELDLGQAKVAKKGNLEADARTYQTAQSDIFVGGDCFTGPKFAIDAIAAGREGAISLHRFVQPGQDLLIYRDMRTFIELDKDDISIPANFDTAKRQVPGRDESKAKSFHDDRLPFTEEQVRAEASRCLGCGATEVDENQCIGCGLCTTKCEFDAIHLSRDLPECSTMVKAEDKVKALLPYLAKREIKILRGKK